MAKILIRLGGTVHSKTGNPSHLVVVRGVVIDFNDREGGHFFTKNTDLRPWKDGQASGIFHHGVPVIPKSLKSILPKMIVKTSRRLSRMRFANPVQTRLEGEAIFAELVLDTRRKEEAFVASLAAQGLLSWSSGAPKRRVKMDRKTGAIIRWGITGVSLVPTAAYPRAEITAAKSIENHELLGRLFGVDVERIMADHMADLIEFQMLHEDESVFLDDE